MTTEQQANCRIRLPGNAECPNTAFYLIQWTRHEPRQPGTKPRVLRRMVCAHHLDRGVDDAIGDSARGAFIEVTIASAADHIGITE